MTLNSTTSRGYETLPLPFGWFAIAMTTEILPGEVKALAYFGTELVVWRGQDGWLHAVDAYCPHLGAHLGYGGEVVGNDLRCPFHHWSFNGAGAVTDIPYSNVIPPVLKRTCLPTWPIEESLGVVYVWYHPLKAAPKWEIATAPEIVDEDWIEAERHEWVVKVHVQEITENGQDYAHFRAVHGTQGPPESEFSMNGWVRHSSVETSMMTPRGPMTGRIDATATGPGQSITRFTDITAVTMMQQVTAIDTHTSHVRWQLYHPPGVSEGKMRVNKSRMRDLVKQLEQDIPIWEHKRYLPQPLLVKGDGPMLAYRRAYTRFYQFEEPAAAVVDA